MYSSAAAAIGRIVLQKKSLVDLPLVIGSIPLYIHIIIFGVLIKDPDKI